MSAPDRIIHSCLVGWFVACLRVVAAGLAAVGGVGGIKQQTCGRYFSGMPLNTSLRNLGMAISVSPVHVYNSHNRNHCQLSLLLLVLVWMLQTVGKSVLVGVDVLCDKACPLDRKELLAVLELCQHVRVDTYVLRLDEEAHAVVHRAAGRCHRHGRLCPRLHTHFFAFILSSV